MTQADKELLLRDLCVRVPYGVKIQYMNNIFAIEYVSPMYGEVKLDASDNWTIGVSEVKPYLFPLSSITKEMMEEPNIYGFFKYRDTIANVGHLESKNGVSEEIYTYIDIESISALMKLFHSHHIDYRGLIEKGLAVDATGLDIY